MPESDVTIVMRMRDEASRPLQQFTGNVKLASASTIGLGSATRQALPGLASMGSSITGLAVGFGFLGTSMGGTIGRMLTFGAAAASAIPAIISLVGVLKQLAVVQAIIAALTMRPWLVPLALGAGIALAVGIKKLASFQEGGIVPGPIGRPQLAMVHGGETITPPGRGAGTVNINIGSYYGDDVSRRTLARDIQKIIREEQRLGR